MTARIWIAELSALRSSLAPAWSPDSRWLSYTKQLSNHMRAVFVYELATGKSHQLTDGMSDAQLTAFDENGSYLYFTASTDIGPAISDFERSSFGRPVTRTVYAILLRKDVPSPLGAVSNVYQFFEGAAGKRTRLRVAPEPAGTGAREVVAVPVEDEWPLRWR